MRWYFIAFVCYVCLFVLVPKSKTVRPQSTQGQYPSAKTKKDERVITNTTELEFDQFAIDDTEALRQLKSQVSCLPASFGYSIEEGRQIFPEFTYPRCDSTYEGVPGNLTLDYAHNTVSLNCQGKYKGKLALPKRPSKLVSNQNNHFIELDYPGDPVELAGFEEYVLASCGEDAPYDIVLTRPRINETLLEEAKSKLGEKSPQRLLHITIDSFSRRHFFRKLTKTTELLNSLKTDSSYEVFDFKLHNIAGFTSTDNQVWIFSGKSRSSREQKAADYSEDIWNLLRPYGFVSLVGFESCNEGFAPAMGKDVSVDHAVNELYCAAHKYTDYSAAKNNVLKQRCIGPQMSHHYLMEYSLEFMESYKEANQWVYMHMDAAHEASGQHAQAIDLDLAEFISKVLGLYNNTIIFLEADHGMRYGEWGSSEEASVEYRLPALFLIAPHESLAEFQGAGGTLSHNTMRLTSKLDLRKTMLELAGFPYTPVKKEVNLLSERIPDKRTCHDVSILDLLCSCTQFNEIDPEVYQTTEYSPLKDMLEHLAKDGIREIREGLMESRGALKHCEALTLDKIIYAAGKVSGTSKEMIELQITVKESLAMKFELNYLIYSKNAFISAETTTLKPIYYLGKKQYRLLFINRLDKYEGPCEELAKTLSIPAKYCLCREL
jgi:hypothetical protein